MAEFDILPINLTKCRQDDINAIVSITLSLDVGNDQYIILCNFGGGFEVMMGDLRSFRFLSQKADPRKKDVVEGNQSIFIFLILFSENVCWSHLRLGAGGKGAPIYGNIYKAKFCLS